MSGSATPTGHASRVFDVTVAVSGAVLGLGALVVLFSRPDPVDVTLFLAAPVVVLMSWFPLLLDRVGGGIEVGFDSCVLVFLASVADPVEALSVWAVGVLVGQLVADKRPSIRAFNVGLGVLAGGAAVWVIEALTRGQEATPRELAGVAVGCAVYFVVDYVVSGVSLALEERSGILPALSHPTVLGALGVFVAIDSLGYLAALVVRELPVWAALLLAVPLATILVAARALSRGNEHARRLSALLAAAARAQSLRDPTAVLDSLRESAHHLLRDERVELRPGPPRSGEIGVHIDSGEGDVWVVGPARNRARANVAADQQALEALGALTEEALGRLRLAVEMGHLARHDALTGLANRTLFLDRVEHALRVQRRRGGRLVVLFCDLDGFKAVNDRFGHAAGDTLLVEVARRISGCVREVDTVARLGGDEFAILLEDVDGGTEVDATCRRILDALQPEAVIAGHKVVVSTSIGVAVSEPRDEADALLRNADLAMYRAKALGKNRYETYELALRDERLHRLETLDALRQAIDAHQFEVHYQPLVEIRSRRILGVEALVRWRRNGELVLPGSFIDLAETGGLISAVTAQVLDQVVMDAPALAAAAGSRLFIGINVSSVQLRASGFVEEVRRTRARMQPAELVLEVTERAFVGDDPDALEAIGRLAAEGMHIMIDDFGVGFSSISYLQHLPVRTLKIDRSFVAGLDRDERACSLVRSMVLMAQGLGLSIVVEGVERESQLAHLRQWDGDTIAQGYLFAAPAPLEETVDMLSASSRGWGGPMTSPNGAQGGVQSGAQVARAGAVVGRGAGPP